MTEPERLFKANHDGYELSVRADGTVLMDSDELGYNKTEMSLKELVSESIEREKERRVERKYRWTKKRQTT